MEYRNLTQEKTFTVDMTFIRYTKINTLWKFFLCFNIVVDLRTFIRCKHVIELVAERNSVCF